MHWRKRTATALAAAALALVSGAAFAQEIIHRFDSRVQIARDGTLTVTETIRVRAEGKQIRRGIFRDFPLTYEDGGGRVREVSFRLLGVLRDGKPEPHFTERQGEAIRIYAGQRDVLLAHGDYTYTFIYETGRQIRWFDGRAELYWNVTGNFWQFPIDAARVRVELAGARPARFTAYTGPYGAHGTDWRGDIDSAGALVIETTQRLERGEGLTIVAELPEAAVDQPTQAMELWYAFLDYRRWIFGFLGFALVLGYYGWAWNAVGRDPKGGPVIPLFAPPDGVSPALSSYIRNWGFRDQWRVFTAACLSLAVRGLILFDDQDGTLTLKATGKQPEGGLDALPPGERSLLTWIRSQGGVARIDRANGSSVATAERNFQKSIEQENRHRFFRRNAGYFVIGLLLTIVAVIGIVTFGGLRESDYITLAFIMFASVWLGVFLVPFLMTIFGALLGRRVTLRSAIPILVFLAVLFYVANEWLTAFPDFFLALVPFVQSTVAQNPFPFALAIGFAALNGLFLYLLRAPTDLGRQVMDQIEGFRLYLTTAETPRLNLEAPEITAERFEALLPYAVALDAERPWSDAFAKAFARAHPGDPDPMRHYRPAWRMGSQWSSRNFSRSVSSSVAGVSASFAVSMPRSSSGSSGFSSGGSSGGGGGGGGGGGW